MYYYLAHLHSNQSQLNFDCTRTSLDKSANVGFTENIRYIFELALKNVRSTPALHLDTNDAQVKNERVEP